jgi:hypothetical protein
MNTFLDHVKDNWEPHKYLEGQFPILKIVTLDLPLTQLIFFNEARNK